MRIFTVASFEGEGAVGALTFGSGRRQTPHLTLEEIVQDEVSRRDHGDEFPSVGAQLAELAGADVLRDDQVFLTNHLSSIQVR